MDFCCPGRFVNCHSSNRPEVPFYGLQTVRHSLTCLSQYQDKPCPDCGAEPGESCSIFCLGLALVSDELESTTN